jgi:tetratricopeptide (TPR) repeat protein
MKVCHCLFKFATADENVRCSPFEGGGGFNRRGLSPKGKGDNPLAAKAAFPLLPRGNLKGLSFTLPVLLSSWLLLPLETQSKEQETAPVGRLPIGSLVSSSTAQQKEIKPAAVAKYRLAESLLQKGNPKEAAEALREATQIQPDFKEAHFALGVILARQGKENHGAAIDQFLEVLRIDPKHVDARINLSNLLEEEGDFEAAAGILKEALSLLQGRPDLYVILGRKQEQAEKYSEAIQSFRRALELDPQTPGAHFGLGMTHRSLGDLAAAGTEFELALQQNPNDANAHYQMGRLLMYRNETAEAIRHFEESVRLKPELAEAHSRLGVLYRSIKKNDEAERSFRTALRLNPKLEKACYGLAQLLQAKGERTEAAVYFEQVQKAKESSDKFAEASDLNANGIALMDAGKLDEASEKFRNALALNPSHAAAAYNLGLVLARQGKTSEAIEAFRTAIRLRPGFLLAHFGLGLALRLAGDPSAESQLRKAQLMKQTAPQLGTINRTIRLEEPD